MVANESIEISLAFISVHQRLVYSVPALGVLGVLGG
jgi:hypothetical protein